MRLKVSTFNIGRMHQDYENNLAILTSLLSRFRPDFLFLQEYVDDERLRSEIGKACGLSLQYFRDFSESHIAKSHRMGVAVFARVPVVETASYALLKPQQAFYYNGNAEYMHDKYFLALSAQAEEPVTFVTGHSFSFNRYGVDPAEFAWIFTPLDEWICSQLHGERNIVVGDFNMECASLLLPELSACYTDLFHGQETRPNGRKTDYIFIPKDKRDFEVVNFRCGSYDPDIGFDHNFLCAEIEL